MKALKMKLTIMINLCMLVLRDVKGEKKKNVCRNFNDYVNIQQNPDCWYDPDAFASPTQLARNHGLPLEVHEIVTEDKYVLTLFRIPHNGSDTNRQRTPLILQHGFFTDAGCYMLNGELSPAFILSNNGFDVWLPNIRGTKYSKKHLKYSPTNREFWNFSFHEMGVFDLPAIINFIAKKTQQRGKIVYVGHSMGTTMFFVYSSTRPKHAAEHIQTMIALAPVAFMTQQLQEALHVYSIGQREINLLTNICTKPPGLLLCCIALAFACGLNADAVKFETLPVVFSQVFSGSSLKTYEHYGQFTDVDGQKGFTYFDYGSRNNLKLYNSTVVPQYNLSQIEVPINLMYGKKDFISEEWNVLRLYKKLKTKKSITRLLPSAKVEFSHQDFLLGVHVKACFDIIMKTISG